MKWNAKKFFGNMLILAGLVGLIALYIAILTGFDKSPTMQYAEHLKNGGTWVEWTETK